MSAELHNLQTRKNIGKAKGLLHSLAPRAQCFCFYDAGRQCIWSSDGADDRTDFETITPERVGEHIMVLYLDRPARANAMNTQMGLDMRELFTDADTYRIAFEVGSWTLEQRLVVFAAAISIDFDFFENNQGRGGTITFGD